MNELVVYAKHGMWVFDEEQLGLKAEAFVRGCSEILTHAIKQASPSTKHITRKKWKVSFGSEPETKEGEKTFSVRWMMQEGEGNWYYCPELDRIGWLCGRLYNFFHKAPRKMYFKIALYKGEELNTIVIPSLLKKMIAFRNRQVGIQLDIDDDDEIARRIRQISYQPSHVLPRVQDRVFHAIQPGTLAPIHNDDDDFEIVLVKADGREIIVQRRKQ